MLTETNSRFDLQEIAGKIWMAKWRVLTFQLLVALGCLAIVFYWPRTYQSRAKIYFQLGRETVGIDPTASTGSMVSIQSNSREDEIISAIEVLKGRGIISSVVDELTPEIVLGLTQSAQSEPSHPLVDKARQTVVQFADKARIMARSIDPISDRERAMILIENNLELRSERKSEVVEIIYDAKTPELAQQVVDSFVRHYQQEHLRLHRNDRSQNFFENQQGKFSEELQAANKALKDAKNRLELASIKGQREILESQSMNIAQGMIDADRDLAEQEARIERIRSDLELIPARINSVEVEKPNAATDMITQQLYTLQLLETELKAKYSPQHPRILAIQKQLAEAEAKYDKRDTKSQETTDDVNPIYRDLTMDLLKTQSQKVGALAKVKALEQQRATLLEKLREINAAEVEVTDLERELAIREKKYLTYTDSLEQARINGELENMRISSVVVAQPATLQERPVSPSKMLIALFGSGVILMGGGALALLLAKLDDRLTTPASVRNHIGIPVLATLPKSRAVLVNRLTKAN